MAVGTLGTMAPEAVPQPLSGFPAHRFTPRRAVLQTDRHADALSRPARADPRAAHPTAGVARLLVEAGKLTAPDVEYLASAALRRCHGPHYAEALLAASRAAAQSGRRDAATTAARRVRMMVARAAAASTRSGLDERARWTIIGERAAWSATDAARALVVADLIGEGHRRLLTLAWEDLRAVRGD